jgi:hypothetical protein
LCLGLGRAAAAQEVGTIAALEGTAKIRRGTARIDAATGTPIHRGDEVETGRPGRVRIVFQDDSVLTISDASRVVIDEQVFRSEAGTARSLFGLVQGKVSALVSEYYQRPGAAYEIRSATAVAGVRGTEFVMTYDPRGDVTEVAGLHGSVEVWSPFDRARRGVFVSAREVTSVTRGRFPTVPRRVSDTLFRQYLEGIEFIGAGASESLTVGHPVLSGHRVPPPDRAAVAAGARTSGERARLIREPRDASDLLHQPPAIFEPGGRLRITF